MTELLSVFGPELSFPFAVKPGGGGGAPFPDEEGSNKGWGGIERERERERGREGGRERVSGKKAERGGREDTE